MDKVCLKSNKLVLILSLKDTIPTSPNENRSGNVWSSSGGRRSDVKPKQPENVLNLRDLQQNIPDSWRHPQK